LFYTLFHSALNLKMFSLYFIVQILYLKSFNTRLIRDYPCKKSFQWETRPLATIHSFDIRLIDSTDGQTDDNDAKNAVQRRCRASNTGRKFDVLSALQQQLNDHQVSIIIVDTP